MTNQDVDLAKVAEWWSQSPDSLQLGGLMSWMDHPHIKRYINRRITGDESLDWLTYITRKYFPKPAERAFSLGCGTGALERHALTAKAVEIFDACDISSGAIETAKQLAQDAHLFNRINYQIADLNTLQLPSEKYDVVFASMSVHHIKALEKVFNAVAKSLKPSGLFIINEYIGPTQFQVPPVQLKLMNDILAILPTNFRFSIVDGIKTDDIKDRHYIHPLQWFAECDPSEAIRSADIESVFKEYFNIVEYKPYGGAILHFMLANIAGNFDDTIENDKAWLNMLEYFEQTLEKNKVINSDFALIVGSKKTGVHNRPLAKVV